jgi:hypothetical protein
MIRLTLAALLLATPGYAAEMAFFMKNSHLAAMAIELYSEKNVWPGGDQVYPLQGGEQKSVPISCAAGETICYGAWQFSDDRISFGVGPNNDRDCADCCAICVAKTTATIDLFP